MRDVQLKADSSKLSLYLDKSPDEFTKRDLIKFIENNGIRAINFRHVGGDGRLKTLNFVVTHQSQLDHLLSAGERVDGSSIFPFMDIASSDLYLIPRYRTAFVNPFSQIPTIDMLCSFYTSEGFPLPSAPENLVRKAHESLKQATGLNMAAMGELEYYILYEKGGLYPIRSQEGYHESSPFSKFEALRCEAMQAISQAGVRVKYGHSEVGHIFQDGTGMEQNEIELLPAPIEDAADQIVLARWILRTIGYKYGVTVSFAPKISIGHAGSGLHIHTVLFKQGHNAMIEEGKLSDTARKAIAGYLSLASSLTAFGNTVPISYLRLGPNQEAPTTICWGDRNRSVLVRVPLGWLNVRNMAKDVNPQETEEISQLSECQTVEFRCPDGSANVHMLLGGLAVAARHGLEMKDAVGLADKLYVEENVYSPRDENFQTSLEPLPNSCWESAESLLRDRMLYERDGVFPPELIDGLARQLKSYNDRDLSDRSFFKGEEIQKLVDEYLNWP